MAAPPHYGPGPDPPQQYPGPRNTNPSSDEVVIYFQNYHNRPSMAMPPQAPLPPPPLHQPSGGKGSCSRGPLNPFPLNFPLPPRPMASMNEHEAAAYFLAHMNETSSGQRDMSHEAGTHSRDMHTGVIAHQTDNRAMTDQSGALRNINNEAVVSRNNNIVEGQNLTVTSRESGQNQNLIVHSRDSIQNQNMVSSKSAQCHNPSTSSRNSVPNQNLPLNSGSPLSNQNLPLNSGSSVSNPNLPISSGNSVSNRNVPLSSENSQVRQQHLVNTGPDTFQNENGAISAVCQQHVPNTSDTSQNQNHAISADHQQQLASPRDSLQSQNCSMSSPNSPKDSPTSLPGGDDDTEQERMLPSVNRLNSSDDEDEDEQQAIIPAQLSTFNVELILSKEKRRMSPEEKVIFNRLKHPLKPPCMCKRKCFEKINMERRKVVNFSFWGLNYVERAMFLLSHVKRNKTNRKTVRGLSRRKFSLNYTMLDENNKLHTVCKIFFVATLGLVSDKCITQLFLKNPVGTLIPQGDMRGKHKPANRIDTTIIKMHIEAYCKQFPVPSKNKNLHIPPGITKMQMYNDFKARVKNYKCGPSRYAQVVKEMNVVFGKKKPPKQPKTSAPSNLPPPSQVGIGTIPNNDRQNQNNNFNRMGNFPYPGVQDNQSLMFPMQQSGTFPPHPQMPLWDQIDQQVHMFQNQFLESGVATSSSSNNHPSNTSSNNNHPGTSSSNTGNSSSSTNHPGTSSNKHQGSTASQSFSITVPPPGLMPLPGFVIPPHLDSSNPTAKGGCENCEACKLERENAAVEAAEAAELEAGCAEGDDDDDEPQQQGSSASTVSEPKPAITCKKKQSSPLNPQQLQAVLSLPQQTPGQQVNPTQPAKIPKRPRNEEERIAIKRMKYPLLPPCKCPKKCREKVNEERRMMINYLFWGLQYQMRAMFLLNHIKQCQAKRHTLARGEPSRRKFSRNYVLPDDQDKLQSVCKIFFLHTLGFSSDSVVTKLLRKNPVGTVVPVAIDRRGKHSPKKKLDTKPIKDHIMSHMRKSKGKFRLPADINVRRMWKDFKLRNPDAKCAYETYRQLVKDIRGSKKSQQQQPIADTLSHPAAHPSAAIANAAAAARATIATTAASVAASSNSAAAAAAHSAVVMDMLRLIDA